VSDPSSHSIMPSSVAFPLNHGREACLRSQERSILAVVLILVPRPLLFKVPAKRDAAFFSFFHFRGEVPHFRGQEVVLSWLKPPQNFLDFLFY